MALEYCLGREVPGVVQSNDENAMNQHTRSTAIPICALKAEALASIWESVALLAALASAASGGERRQAHRWGRT